MKKLIASISNNFYKSKVKVTEEKIQQAKTVQNNNYISIESIFDPRVDVSEGVQYILKVIHHNRINIYERILKDNRLNNGTDRGFVGVEYQQKDKNYWQTMYQKLSSDIRDENDINLDNLGDTRKDLSSAGSQNILSIKKVETQIKDVFGVYNGHIKFDSKEEALSQCEKALNTVKIANDMLSNPMKYCISVEDIEKQIVANVENEYAIKCFQLLMNYSINIYQVTLKELTRYMEIITNECNRIANIILNQGNSDSQNQAQTTQESTKIFVNLELI